MTRVPTALMQQVQLNKRVLIPNTFCVARQLSTRFNRAN
jgi:hypothetical protein